MANKKKNQNKKTEVVNTKIEYKTVIKTSIIIAIIFGAFYLLTGIITGNISFAPEPGVQIQYSEILVGETFNREDDNYLVIYFDSTEEDATLYNTYLYNYQLVEGALKYYTVDMAQSLNQPYKAETSTLNVTKASELKIGEVAMVEIKEGQIANVWETKEAVVDYFD